MGTWDPKSGSPEAYSIALVLFAFAPARQSTPRPGDVSPAPGRASPKKGFQLLLPV